MVELARRGQNSVQELLDLRITSFGLIKDLADEVDRALYLIGVSDFLAFDDDSCANDTRSNGDVDR